MFDWCCILLIVLTVVIAATSVVVCVVFTRKYAVKEKELDYDFVRFVASKAIEKGKNDFSLNVTIKKTNDKEINPDGKTPTTNNP